ncbi:MAG: ankyrin repeat domain-containing protein [Rhodothermia bacterium]|nr:ankyrin repeat domain-containing protein [Rhodothermia bacterium]
MNSEWEAAVTSGDSDAVSQLLREGANVDARDRYGRTGLMIAAHAGHLHVVETLIASGADLNVTAKYGFSALMLAAVSGHEEIARTLAAAGADRAIRGTGAPGFDGKTAADLAADLGLGSLAADLDIGRRRA